MIPWSVITIVVCAEIVVAVDSGKLQIPEPSLCQHPTLVAMLEKSNNWRAQYGLQKQPVSPYLTELAQNHANWMANNGRFQHNYDHPYPEIIYWNARSVESAFDGWMQSPPHRAILLDGSTHVGYGYAIAPTGETYWCGIFGNMAEEKLPTIMGTLVSTKETVVKGD